MTDRELAALAIEIGPRALRELEAEDAIPFSRIKRRARDAAAIAGARRMVASGGIIVHHRMMTHNRHLNIDAGGERAR